MWSCGCGHKGHQRVLIAKAKPGDEKLTAARLFDAIARSMENAVRISFTRGLTTFKKRINTDEIERHFESGNEEAIFETIPFDRMAEDIGYSEAVKTATLRAGKLSLRRLKPQRKTLRFDTKNPRIDRDIARNTGQKIVQISEEARRSVANTVKLSFNQGMNPKQAAKLIEESVGLTEKQTTAIARSQVKQRAERDQLRGALARLDSEGKGQSLTAMNARAKLRNLTDEKIEKRAIKMSEKMQKNRARSIARTEMTRAVNAGQMEVWQQGVEDGLIDRNEAKKQWITVNDADRSDICTTLDRKIVGLDENFFVTQTGESVPYPPAHPNCRSSVTIVLTEE